MENLYVYNRGICVEIDINLEIKYHIIERWSTWFDNKNQKRKKDFKEQQIKTLKQYQFHIIKKKSSL